ncbi:MAG: nucleotidyltransferase domain-containing protein [Oscillospiraceae bacterium]|nr:nucleotidyltransferase domain-containing protein [Oscillospiraceae bacterium]
MAQIPSETIRLIEDFIKSVKADNIKIEKVILFGSYAKGNYSKDSDIDLAIISPDFKENECISNMSKLLLKATKLRADIQTLPFSLDEYNKPKGIMEEILNTGIELNIA